MNPRWSRIFVLPFFCLFFVTACASTSAPSNQTVQKHGSKSAAWSNVAIGGGGYVTGLVTHPLEQDLVYIRTDVGGFYRWNPADNRWVPLTDWINYDALNDFGGDAIALDPNDPEVVYIATGAHTADYAPPGKIYKSSDRGETWHKISPDWDVKMGGGDWRRWAGERLAVSPDDGQTILFGSRNDGLWRTTNDGSSWQQLNIGNPEEELGITSLVFDPNSEGRVYAAVHGDAIFQSDDDGASWQKLEGSPVEGMHLAVGGDGTLWATHVGGVGKYAGGTWVNYKPAGDAVHNALTVNPRNADEVLVAPVELYQTAPLFRTIDGGATWTEKTWSYHNTVPWTVNSDYGEKTWFRGEIAALAFDPFVENRVWLSNWFFVSRTDDIQAQPATWTNLANNLENTVNLALAPLADGTLLSGFADTGGFRHDNGLDAFPSKRLDKLEEQPNTWNYNIDFAVSPSDPLTVMRVGCTCYTAANGLARSDDGGRSWSLVHQWDEDADHNGRPIRVAMSADPNSAGPKNIVVLRQNAPVQYSQDGGATWNDAAGLEESAVANGPFYWGQPLTADAAKPGTFYFYDYQTETVYRSSNGGKTFRSATLGLKNDDSENIRGTLKATPGVAGELWLSLSYNGLYRSKDGGRTFGKLKNVTYARVFGFGKSARGRKTPTLFLYGQVKGQDGIWMSTNQGQSWRNIQNPEIKVGDVPMVLEGSRKTFGQVFIGTVGRGIYVGEVSKR